MTNSSSRSATWHTIADIERDTGLSKDTLRVWERRYGFPDPERDALGERRYDDAQLERLRHIRRLIDAGHRPGQVVPLPREALLELNTQTGARRIQTVSRRAPAATPASAPSEEIEVWLQMLHRYDGRSLRLALTRTLEEQGLARLLLEGVAPMNALVGDAWLAGRLGVHQEHLYSEIVQSLLRQAISQVNLARPLAPPRVLLTTLPGEEHGLGLLMAECFLALEGCETLPLGVQTPVPDIVNAVSVSGAHIVALGFTAAQNPRDALGALEQLRSRLLPEVKIWTGGNCPALLRSPRSDVRASAPFQHLARLQDIPMAVTLWRSLVQTHTPAQRDDS
ncbi:MerR family transcriptional regulator [Hydrogenophaga sp.]|uniref:MerR family transcriptional regulator n=1 Tax=Hydrogenophaga sp. TaxID=1904254 RepID=UPI003F6FD167